MKTGLVPAALILVGLTACQPAVDAPETLALDMLAENFQDTDLSARVDVTSAETGESVIDGVSVKHIWYSASVLETYSGQHQSNIQFKRYLGSDNDLQADETGTFIVSLCRDNDGSFYIPDVGFEMDDSDRIVERARLLATEPPPTGDSSQQERAAACR